MFNVGHRNVFRKPSWLAKLYNQRCIVLWYNTHHCLIFLWKTLKKTTSVKPVIRQLAQSINKHMLLLTAGHWFTWMFENNTVCNLWIWIFFSDKKQRSHYINLQAHCCSSVAIQHLLNERWLCARELCPHMPQQSFHNHYPEEPNTCGKEPIRAWR